MSLINCCCGEEFLSVRGAKYCRKEKTVSCELESCHNQFTYICNKLRPKRFCSVSCQSTYISNLESVKEAKRNHPNKGFLDRDIFLESLKNKYGEGVTNPSQIESVKEKRRTQLKENQEPLRKGMIKKYGVDNPMLIKEHRDRNTEINRAAQNREDVKIKRLKARNPHIRHVEEYMNLDHSIWALEFYGEYGKEPTPFDLQLYFNTKSPIQIPYESKEFFNLKDSQLELKFNALLKEQGWNQNEDYFRRKRFLREGDERFGKEIDFFFPNLMVGFEIQDDATHSKIDDNEPTIFKKHGLVKRGPAYHENKHRLASSYQISLIEVWQEEFSDMDTLYDKVLLALIEQEIPCFGSKYENEYLKEEIKASFSTGELKEIPQKLQTDDYNPWWDK